MEFDPSIFKSYDVRGIYPETIDEELAEKIGIAFVNHFNLKNVAVGRDGRISSPQLSKALIRGITKADADVTDVGEICSDMVYFASGNYDFDGAAMVTASHNPSQYNGFKFCLKGAVPVSGDDGIYAIRDLIQKDELKTVEKIGVVVEKNIYADYVNKLLSLIDVKKIKPLKIVVDAGNGIAGKVITEIFKSLPCQIVPLYFEIDGNFPNHQPSPIEEKNLVDLKAKVRAEKADLGLAFDGDGDRVFFIDEKANGVSATLIAAMVSELMLEKFPGSRILYNVNVGWVVKETIEKMGGIPSVTPVGHSLIKAQMRKEDGLFASEHSGHYFYRNLSYADSGMVTTLIVLEIISKANQSLSEIVKKYDIYSLSGEINTEVADAKAKIAEIKSKYSDGKISELDGLAIEYSDWHFTLRSSNTEPLLRLNVEAKTKEIMEQKRDELLELIRS